MFRRRPTESQGASRGWLRGAIARFLVLAVVLPVLLVKPCGGLTLLTHTHGDDSTHLHVGATGVVNQRLAAWHAGSHEQGLSCLDRALAAPCEDACPISSDSIGDPDSEGVLVSVPAPDCSLTRGVALPAVLSSVYAAIPVAWCPAEPPCVRQEEGSPGGRPLAPLSRVPRRVCDRIVSTSNALLV